MILRKGQVVKKQFRWRLKYNGIESIVKVEISFLNGKCWIPGKNHTKSIDVIFSTAGDAEKLTNASPTILSLCLYSPVFTDDSKDKLLETWQFSNFKVSLIDHMQLRITYENVIYK